MSVNTVQQKRDNEKEIVTQMIAIYCSKHHHTKDELCPTCLELKEYACSRTDHCPFMQTKTFCSACKVHCYAPEKRAQIKQVMKYSGPRMLFHHPVLLIKHMKIKTSN